ncbi:MAG: hypothetical protein OXG04_01735 [Acidobacteria bacterium]|nr:hypothetical protein [Acidobacteriota bacterium]
MATDSEATGTIENADPMPAVLLARFGRATAEQVAQHIEERRTARRGSGASGCGSPARSCGPAAITTSLPAEVGLLASQDDEELKRAFGAWTKQAVMSPQFRATETEPLEEMRAMLAETVHEWTKDWVGQGREEGRLLCRLAARKFDAGAAARLATALSDVADPNTVRRSASGSSSPKTATDLVARILDKTSAGD